MSHVPCPMSLFVARDKNKDQSYFLWTLTQEQLRHCLFPIGDYVKPEVRKIAARVGLSTADKKDSQGICFLGKFSLKDFLRKRIRCKKGKVVTTSGVFVGEHDGAAFYTIGQRRIGVANRGLSLTERGTTRKDFKPFYVADKDIKTNTLIVAEGEKSPALYKREVLLKDVNFIDSHFKLKARSLKLPVLARVRYRQPLVEAALVISKSKLVNKKHHSSITNCQLRFSSPIKFIAGGQSAVFYSRKGELLGGGVITRGD